MVCAVTVYTAGWWRDGRPALGCHWLLQRSCERNRNMLASNWLCERVANQ
jgi:hypothetical protein